MNTFKLIFHKFNRIWKWQGLLIAVSILVLNLMTACGRKDQLDTEEKPQYWKYIKALPKPKETLSRTLRVLIWHDYIDPEIIAYFEKLYDTKIEITFFENNEDLKNKFAQNPDGFDILMPSDYVVERFRKQGNVIAPIRKENIPNLGHISPILFQSPYDPELVYSVPMFYCCLGVSFNSKKVQYVPRNFSLRSKSATENLNLHGYRALLDEPRVSLSAALLDDGVDPNHPTIDQLNRTANRLIEDAKALGTHYMASTLPEHLIKNEIMLAVNWSGAAAVAVQKNPAIRFVLPEGKKFIQVDSFVIPLRAKNKYTAEFFINFLLIPEISGDLTNYSFYANSNQSSSPFISRDILLGPAYMEPPTTMRVFFTDLGDMEDNFESTWRQIKSSAPDIKAKVPDLVKEIEENNLQRDRVR
ncbi:MAG: spermidine/putrescine ABC transporter substrate-binding protein [Opitutaceae bacterium]